MCLSGLAFPSRPHCVLLVHLPPVQPTTPSLLLFPLHNCPAPWLCFFDPHSKQHSPSGFVLIPCSRKTHLNLFIDTTAVVFHSVGHLWAYSRQKPRRPCSVWLRHCPERRRRKKKKAREEGHYFSYPSFTMLNRQHSCCKAFAIQGCQALRSRGCMQPVSGSFSGGACICTGHVSPSRA